MKHHRLTMAANLNAIVLPAIPLWIPMPFTASIYCAINPQLLHPLVKNKLRTVHLHHVQPIIWSSSISNSLLILTLTSFFQIETETSCQWKAVELKQEEAIGRCKT
jgi:hypothetical protein